MSAQLSFPVSPAEPRPVGGLHEERERLRRRVGHLLAKHRRLRASGDLDGARAAWVEANQTEARARALSEQIRRAA